MKKRWNNFKNICTLIYRYRTLKRAFEKVCRLTPVEMQLLRERSAEESEGLIELGELYFFFHIENRLLKKDLKKIKEMVDTMDKL